MNVQEAQIQALIIQAEAVKVEVVAMQTHDQFAIAAGIGAYTEETYNDMANQLRLIANEIQVIAGQGWLS